MMIPVPVTKALRWALWMSLGGISACQAAKPTAPSRAQAIYGTDARYDLYETAVIPMARERARSVALLVPRKSLLEVDDDHWQLHSQPLSERFGTCSSERFSQQPSAGFCTAFLIAPDRLATAGHCLNKVTDCGIVHAVFGFAYDTRDKDPTLVRKEDVYRCTKVIAEQQNATTGIDFAILQLDRPVKDRPPLTLGSQRQVRTGAKVAMLGFPRGVPMKADIGKKVTASSQAYAYFRTNLDVFYYNSGSPVFFQDDGTVAGMLVRGIGDQVFDGANQCYRPLRCRGQRNCRGEEVVKSQVLDPFATTGP